jgi:hypothetical protein
MLIGTREEQFAWIEGSRLVRVDIDHRHWYGPMSRGFYEGLDLDLLVETEQSKVRT